MRFELVGHSLQQSARAIQASQSTVLLLQMRMSIPHIDNWKRFGITKLYEPRNKLSKVTPGSSQSFSLKRVVSIGILRTSSML